MLTSPQTASAPQDEGFEVPAQFRVHDRQTANWVVRKVVEARSYGEQIDQWAEAERRRARREGAFFLRRFEAELRAWLDSELANQGGKSKSINLPAGRVGIRRLSAKIEVLDQAAVLAWAQHHCPEAIKRVESIRKTPLNEHFQATGEVPDGTTVRDEQDTFYIR